MKTKYKILVFISFLVFLTLYQIYVYNTLIKDFGYVMLQRLYIPALIVVVIVVVFYLLLTFSIIKPIERITGYIVDISRGELGTEIDPKLKGSRDEVGELASAFDRTIVSLKLAMKMTAPELKKEADALKKALEAKNKAQEELRSSRDYVDNILKSMSDTLIIINRDGTIRTVNQATLDLLGYRQEELIGKPVDLIVTPLKGRGQIIFKEIFNLGELIERDFVRDYEIVYRSKDGRNIPMSLSGSVMRDKGEIKGIVAIARDITGRKKAEYESKATRFIESMSDCVTLLDMHGGITDVNRAMTELIGYAKEELMGKIPAELFIAEKDRERFFEGLEKQLSDKPGDSFKCNCKSRGGVEFTANVNLYVTRDSDDTPNGIVAVYKRASS